MLLQNLEKIEAAPLGNDRLEVLRQSDSPQLRSLLKSALDPAITFGVKKLPKPRRLSGMTFNDESQWFRLLMELLDPLQTRRLTGKAAQTAIAVFLGSCTEVQRKWSERVIKQDLRIGIGAKEVNNTLGDVVFEFGVPLATDFAKAKDLSGNWIIQPKLDGCRTVAYLYANGDVTLFSRTGKQWKNFESVREKLREINAHRYLYRGRDIVLDGEMVSYVDDKIDFQALQSTLFNKQGVEHGKLKYVVFDVALKTEWEAQKGPPYSKRFEEANTFVSTATMNVPGSVFKIAFVKGFTAREPSKQNLLDACNYYVNSGYEGAMMRRAESGIELKRTKNLLKIKTFQDDEAVVIGVTPGTGKYAHVMGALVCKTKTDKTFEIGSGFSDEQRKKFSTDVVGKTLVYKYQELTDDSVPRFPIFKGFRVVDDLGKNNE